MLPKNFKSFATPSPLIKLYRKLLLRNVKKWEAKEYTNVPMVLNENPNQKIKAVFFFLKKLSLLEALSKFISMRTRKWFVKIVICDTTHEGHDISEQNYLYQNKDIDIEETLVLSFSSLFVTPDTQLILYRVKTISPDTQWLLCQVWRYFQSIGPLGRCFL